MARWVREVATDHAAHAAEFELVDLKEFELPMLDEPVPALMSAGQNPHTVRWAERIGSYDAFVFVTPEYNRRAPASLSNAIDYLYQEWTGKPVAFVGYGVYGAVMAVQELRAQAGALTPLRAGVVA